jgi:CRP/FNR family nitrogen fixation transcriptional regulator
MLGKHRCFPEATMASSVLVLTRKRLVSLADTSPRVAKHLLDITNIELQRAQNHGLLLRSSSDERVARFLLEMTKRDRKKEVDLQMSRQDIADHLDLTIETVSRALTRLNNASAISVLTQRRVAVHVRKLRVA